MIWFYSNILCCLYWSFYIQSGLHIKIHLHHWWYSHRPGPVSPGRHTWPQLPQQQSPKALPVCPTYQHTEEVEWNRQNITTEGNNWHRTKGTLTSLSTALKRPLLVLVLLFVEEVFLKPPYLASVLLLIVSALSLGASPSITKTSFTPISVRDETLKNKFLHTEVSLRIKKDTGSKDDYIGRN